MAVVRARTSPPYALILFVVLWVITAGIAVFLVTQQGDLKKQAQAAIDDLAKSKRELGEVTSQRQKLISQITNNGVAEKTGTDNASREATDVLDNTGKVLNLAQEKKPRTIADAAKLLTDRIEVLNKQVETLEADKKRANGEAEAARTAKAASDAEKAKGLADATETIKKQEAEIARLNAAIPETAAQGQAALSKQQEAYENQIRQLGIQIAELKGLLAKAQLTIVNQKNEIMAGRRLITSTVSDIPSGKIVRTNVAAGECTIALGVKDHVTRGLTFLVFDQRTGVKVGKDDEPGKGAIEIVEVGEFELRCRVIHLERNMRIEQGDLIYNLVFSQQKNRQYRFAVYGDFDLDGDGNATATERERLVAMIKSWGGRVDEIPVVELRDLNGQPIVGPDGKVVKAPQVMPETDFLVQGSEPVDPKMSKDLDLVSAETIEKLKNDYQQFKVIEGSARSSGVTILNTNRFLYLIGYYNTTLVRY